MQTQRTTHGQMNFCSQSLQSTLEAHGLMAKPQPHILTHLACVESDLSVIEVVIVDSDALGSSSFESPAGQRADEQTYRHPDPANRSHQQHISHMQAC
jgi:hypothetical protein